MKCQVFISGNTNTFVFIFHLQQTTKKYFYNILENLILLKDLQSILENQNYAVAAGQLIRYDFEELYTLRMCVFLFERYLKQLIYFYEFLCLLISEEN